MNTQTEVEGALREPFVDTKGRIRLLWHKKDDELKKAIVEWVNGRLPGSSEKRSLLFMKVGASLVWAEFRPSLDVEWFFEQMENEIDRLLRPTN